MKKFSDRSKRGQRNLIILYSVIGCLLLFLFILLNELTFSKSDFSSSIYTQSSISESTTDIGTSPVLGPITAEYNEPNLESISNNVSSVQISKTESDFISAMLPLLGNPMVASSDTDLTNIADKEDFLHYGLKNLTENYKKEDFYEVSYSELHVGDIAIFESGYGFYIGQYNGEAAFVTSSSIGSIFSISNPTISLVYDAGHNDELCNGWYPIAFTNYYHLNSNTFSEGYEIDLSTYYKVLDKNYSHYAYRVYSLNKIFRNADFVKSSTLLNVVVPEKNNFYFNSDKYIDYFMNFVSELSKISNQNIENLYFSISTIYATTSCCIISIDANFIENDAVVMTSFEYSFYADGTYLPFNVFTETGFSKYGFTYLGIGESLATEKTLPEGISSQNGHLIQKEDGTWVLRGGGFEQDVTNMIENEFFKNSKSFEE